MAHLWLVSLLLEQQEEAGEEKELSRRRATILTFTPPAHLAAASRMYRAPMLLKRPTAVSSAHSQSGVVLGDL